MKGGGGVISGAQVSVGPGAHRIFIVSLSPTIHKIA